MKSEKNHFYCSFIVQNPIQTRLRFQIFQVFSKKLIFLLFRSSTLNRWEKWIQQKFLMLFCSAISISDHFTITKFFKFFFSKNQFFSLFQPLYCKGEKHEVRRKSCFSAFCSAKSISDHFTISKLYQVFFRKINFFHCFDPFNAKVRNMKSEGNHVLVLFCSAKSISDHFTISKLFQVFFLKNQIFSLFWPL